MEPLEVLEITILDQRIRKLALEDRPGMRQERNVEPLRREGVERLLPILRVDQSFAHSPYCQISAADSAAAMIRKSGVPTRTKSLNR